MKNFFEQLLAYAILTVILTGLVAVFAPAGSWYAVKYDVPVSHVIVEPEPHDCDFIRAPIGDKGCDYVAVVRKTDGRVFVSWELETSAEGHVQTHGQE